MWDKSNCAVVWAFFGIASLWDWNENWPFPVLWPLLSFPNLRHIEHCTLTASSYRTWNNSTGIPSSPLALLVLMLSKDHLILNSRMSGSRWVIIPEKWVLKQGIDLAFEPWINLILIHLTGNLGPISFLQNCTVNIFSLTLNMEEHSFQSLCICSTCGKCWLLIQPLIQILPWRLE